MTMHSCAIQKLFFSFLIVPLENKHYIIYILLTRFNKALTVVNVFTDKATAAVLLNFLAKVSCSIWIL